MSPRKKNETELHLALLGFFLENNFHGYELFKYLTQESEFGKIWFIKQSQLYNFLDRLHIDGYLHQEIQEGDLYPDRKKFSISVTGRLKFLGWLVEPVSHGRDMRQLFLLKLFFSMNTEKKLAKELVCKQKATCLRWFEGIRKNDKNEETEIQYFIADYRVRQIQAMLDWLNNIEQKILFK
jgi:DNA-binding PadR family transcriptional regulator